MAWFGPGRVCIGRASRSTSVVIAPHTTLVKMPRFTGWFELHPLPMPPPPSSPVPRYFLLVGAAAKHSKRDRKNNPGPRKRRAVSKLTCCFKINVPSQNDVPFQKRRAVSKATCRFKNPAAVPKPTCCFNNRRVVSKSTGRLKTAALSSKMDVPNQKHRPPAPRQRMQ